MLRVLRVDLHVIIVYFVWSLRNTLFWILSQENTPTFAVSKDKRVVEGNLAHVHYLLLLNIDYEQKRNLRRNHLGLGWVGVSRTGWLFGHDAQELPTIGEVSTEQFEEGNEECGEATAVSTKPVWHQSEGVLCVMLAEGDNTRRHKDVFAPSL